MRIFVVDPSFFGLLYDVQFCAALAEAGHEVTLVGRRLRSHEEVNSGGFEILPLFYRISESLPALPGSLGKAFKGVEHAVGMRRLIRLVEREKPDVLHLQWIILPLIDGHYLAKLEQLVPIVLTVHNSVPYHGASSSSLMLKGQEKALLRATRYIPHTKDIAAYLERHGIGPERYDVLPHPAVHLPEPPREVEPSTDGMSRILFFGTIKPYKGVDVLIEAVIRLAESRRDFHLTIAGKPFYDVDPIVERVRSANVSDLVTFDFRHLPEADLSTYLASTDIVVFPYREIDASGAFACASQFGKPIVASEIGVFAGPPVCDHVALVPPADPGALASRLGQILEDSEDRSNLADLSRRLQDHMYSWQRFADDCVTIYESLRRQ